MERINYLKMQSLREDLEIAGMDSEGVALPTFAITPKWSQKDKIQGEQRQIDMALILLSNAWNSLNFSCKLNSWLFT